MARRFASPELEAAIVALVISDGLAVAAQKLWVFAWTIQRVLSGKRVSKHKLRRMRVAAVSIGALPLSSRAYL